MSAQLRSFRSGTFLLIIVLISTLFATACDTSEERKIPDPKYVYSDTAPAGATIISDEEFTDLIENHQIGLDGPEANAETEAREQAQDEEDKNAIEEYQRANPNMRPVLPELTLPRNGTVRPKGANFELDVVLKNSRTPVTVTTMGDRFRLRTAAQSIRAFPSKENQLAMYSAFFNAIDPSIRVRLQLPTVDEAARSDARAILSLNDRIALNWEIVLGTLPPPAPILPPSCDSDEHAGTAGDRFGNSTDPSCGYSANGLMVNYNWSGKEHISCVKDQARRGTCPAFSSISTMEYSVHKKFGRHVNLSEQALYARMKLTWAPNSHLGDGYWPAAGFTQSFNERYLVPYEEQWNYNPSSSRVLNFNAGPDMISGNKDDVLVSYTSSCASYPETCSNSTHQTSWVCAEFYFGYVCGYVFPSVNPENAGFRVASGSVNFWDPANRDLSLAKAILAVGLLRSQIIWGFDVEPSSWSPNADGFVTYNSGTETTQNGAHAVHVVGIIPNNQLAQILPNAPAGAGGGYFIVKNSWANCWGDGGFAYIPYNSLRDYSLEVNSAPSVE